MQIIATFRETQRSRRRSSAIGIKARLDKCNVSHALYDRRQQSSSAWDEEDDEVERDCFGAEGGRAPLFRSAVSGKRFTILEKNQLIHILRSFDNPGVVFRISWLLIGDF